MWSSRSLMPLYSSSTSNYLSPVVPHMIFWWNSLQFDPSKYDSFKVLIRNNIAETRPHLPWKNAVFMGSWYRVFQCLCMHKQELRKSEQTCIISQSHQMSHPSLMVLSSIWLANLHIFLFVKIMKFSVHPIRVDTCACKQKW